MKRPPISRQSDKAKGLQSPRSKCRRIVMDRCDHQCEMQAIWAKHEWAIACRCTRRATEVHEIEQRSACGDITDPNNCIAACHNCHAACKKYPALARRAGLVCSRYAGDECKGDPSEPSGGSLPF